MSKGRICYAIVSLRVPSGNGSGISIRRTGVSGASIAVKSCHGAHCSQSCHGASPAPRPKKKIAKILLKTRQIWRFFVISRSHCIPALKRCADKLKKIAKVAVLNAQRSLPACRLHHHHCKFPLKTLLIMSKLFNPSSPGTRGPNQCRYLEFF